MTKYTRPCQKTPSPEMKNILVKNLKKKLLKMIYLQKNVSFRYNSIKK